MGKGKPSMTRSSRVKLEGRRLSARSYDAQQLPTIRNGLGQLPSEDTIGLQYHPSTGIVWQTILSEQDSIYSRVLQGWWSATTFHIEEWSRSSIQGCSISFQYCVWGEWMIVIYLLYDLNYSTTIVVAFQVHSNCQCLLLMVCCGWYLEMKRTQYQR